MIDTLARWHEVVQSHDPTRLQDLLADTVVFHSPVVHAPQRGKHITLKYLTAAMQVFANGSFHYVSRLHDDQQAVLEFMVDIDDVTINGVDLIRWDAAGRIIEFKVMIRPLRAIHLIQQKMAAVLQAAR